LGVEALEDERTVTDVFAWPSSWGLDSLGVRGFDP
jgi:hypothetical protein